MLVRARVEVQDLVCSRKGQAGGTQQRIVPAAGSSPRLELEGVQLGIRTVAGAPLLSTRDHCHLAPCWAVPS